MEYILNILVLICIYSILAISLNILAGQTGILSMGQAAFYGIGAYTSALMAIHFGSSFLLGVIAGMFFASLVSLLLSLPSLRLHDDYFVMATFGFQMIVFSVLNNWVDFTQGPLGIPGIPKPKIFGWTITSHAEFVIVAAVVTAFAYIISDRISLSPLGRVLRAIREDELFAQAMGKNTVKFKMIAFAVSAALAATAGSLYAHYITYIDPTSFTVLESILVVSMVIIGGADSRWGPLIGACFLIVLPEALRFVGFSNSIAANLRQIIYGLLLVVIFLVRPHGLVGKYGFKK